MKSSASATISAWRWPSSSRRRKSCRPSRARSSKKKLAQNYERDYVSLYRVDRQAEVFRLFYQNKDASKLFLIRPDYAQPFSIGMLGSRFHLRKTVVINEIGNPKF
ncbi:hypothetical protein AWB66_04952 [Caballeronia telluris]|uniref:Uncharacterized protein n=1 Tax=Caballeronia telluris TaxID=326475 RepID=A0A158K067_9BURK|nr:hypothetical protein AWB66_04952 [Caballeronia telluris]